MIYLVFNEGYSRRRDGAGARAALRRGDPAGAPAAAPVPDRAGDHGPDRADAAAARARRRPASTPTARSSCWRTRTAAAVERQADRRGPGADRQGDAPPPARPLSGPGRDRRPARPRRARRRTPTGRRSTLLYAALERLQPSPVVTLNRAVAVAKVRGPAAALAMIEPLATALAGYFHFFGAQGRLPAAARPHGRGARRLRPGHRAGQHAGRGRPHPPASRPADARKRRTPG